MKRVKRDEYWRQPKKAGEGWWYANARSIEIHCDSDHNRLHTVVRISRKALAEYLRRSEKRKE